MSKQQAFAQQLSEYKQLIDKDIAEYSQEVRAQVARQFTPYSELAVDAFLQILSRGGKRVRGALTMVGYQMCGGKNQAMITVAARAIEMSHAYILIMDDIMDRSQTRRGDKTAHIMLAEYHQAHQLKGDALHFGEAIASNAALIGSHAAQALVANLAADPQDVIKAMSILNHSLTVTGHGQVNDMFNEVVTDADPASVDNVLEWKTAHYTFLNPIHFGMVLAGAGCEHTDAITEYCMHAGRAFQITDDVLGTFGDQQESGKSPLDDIREGKRTLLTVTALERASEQDATFLRQQLGNDALTPEDFARCKQIIETTGALEYTNQQAEAHCAKAKASLQAHASLWPQDSVHFLEGLLDLLLTRKK